MVILKKEREVAGSIENIVDSLRWAGIEWDEGFNNRVESEINS